MTNGKNEIPDFGDLSPQRRIELTIGASVAPFLETLRELSGDPNLDIIVIATRIEPATASESRTRIRGGMASSIADLDLVNEILRTMLKHVRSRDTEFTVWSEGHGPEPEQR